MKRSPAAFCVGLLILVLVTGCELIQKSRQGDQPLAVHPPVISEGLGVLMLAYEGIMSSQENANPVIVSALKKALANPCNPRAMQAMEKLFTRYKNLSLEQRTLLVGKDLATATPSDAIPLEVVMRALFPGMPAQDPERTEQEPDLPQKGPRDIDTERGPDPTHLREKPSERGCSPDRPDEGLDIGVSAASHKLYSIEYKGFHTITQCDGRIDWPWGTSCSWGSSEPYFVFQMFRRVGDEIITWQKESGAYGDVDDDENRFGPAGDDESGMLLDSGGTRFYNPTAITVMGFEDDGCWIFSSDDYDDVLSDIQTAAETASTVDETGTAAAIAAAAGFLQNLGDAIEYVFDCGDDWIGSASINVSHSYAASHEGVRTSCPGCNPPYLTAFESDLRLHLNDGDDDGHFDLYFDIRPF